MTGARHANWTRVHELIGEILLREWDPIGVSGFSEATSEYDSYVPKIYELLVKGASVTEVYDYLRWAETKNMALPGDHAKTQRIAERLVGLSLQR